MCESNDKEDRHVVENVHCIFGWGKDPWFVCTVDLLIFWQMAFTF